MCDARCGPAARMANIEETLQYINERMAELDAEKEELKRYQELDRTRRALEYTVYDRELAAAKEAIDKVIEESDSRLRWRGWVRAGEEGRGGEEWPRHKQQLTGEGPTLPRLLTLASLSGCARAD